MAAYDIIGDVHGCAFKLEALLEELGYRVDPWTGAYGHAHRQAVFVGDLIDRGPSQLRTLEIVKAMADTGSAQVVMGNHEFNAITYAAHDPGDPARPLRKHSPKNRHQHEAFLCQLTRDQQRHYLAWFRSLPLWLDLGGLRVVHACWHEPSIAVLRQALGGDRFTSLAQLVEATTRRSALYDAVEVVLKGPEFDLTRYGAPAFRDKDGHLRTGARIRWWNAGAERLVDLAEVPTGATGEDHRPYRGLPDVSLAEDDRAYAYAGAVPVFYGHYWRQGVPHELEDWTATTACVDFSAVKGGTLVAYRWDGEPRIDPGHYHPHGPDLVGPTPSDTVGTGMS
jgi:hypothetical protein